jgi:hypothetical protein
MKLRSSLVGALTFAIVPSGGAAATISQGLVAAIFRIVGARGFEPRTSRSRSVRAAELRYAPNLAPGRLVACDTLPKCRCYLLYLNQIVWQLDTLQLLG